MTKWSKNNSAYGIPADERHAAYPANQLVIQVAPLLAFLILWYVYGKNVAIRTVLKDLIPEELD